MQRRPIAQPQPKQWKTPIILCIILVLLLAFAASINMGLNSQLSQARADADEAQTAMYDMQTQMEDNEDKINDVMSQFINSVTSNQTNISLDDFTVQNITTVLEDALDLYTYTNGTMTVERYYFPSIDLWSAPYITGGT